MATLILPFRPADFTLAGTLRAVNDANGTAQRIELKPQSPFAGDPEFDSSSLSAWTTLNSASAIAINSNTTRKSKLYCQTTTTSSDWFNVTATGPAVIQVISGDFDLYSAVGLEQQRINGSAGINAISTSSATTFERARLEYVSSKLEVAQVSNTAGTGVYTPVDITGTLGNAPYVFVRLKRGTNTFTHYYSLDGFNWSLIGSHTNNAFSADQKLGASWANASTTAITGTLDFIRNWPPYDTTSPSASIVIDSGSSGTAWGMSSFIGLENPYMEYAPYSQIGFGTVKYQYGASDTNPPTLNGTWLSLATMQAQSNPTGRYFKLSVQLNATNGYEFTSFAGGSIQATISAAPTYSSY